MNIPSTLLKLGEGFQKVPKPVPTEESATTSKLGGVAGGATAAVIDSVGLTGTSLLQTIPFQLKAQRDLWNSDRSLVNKLAWSTGLVGINAAVACLSPIVGAGVGAYYGYHSGSQNGVAAAAKEGIELVKFVNGFMGDTFRDTPREEGPSAPPSSETVQVNYLTQDPAVGTPEVGKFSKSMMGDSLNNDRIIMDDGEPFMPGMTLKAHPSARPDAQGNYLFQPGTPEFQQTQSFVSANLTLNLFEKAMGHKIPWAFEGPLAIHPHAGEGFNAFYARQFHSLNFFDGADPVAGKTIHGSESLDVTSHEAGHAILDAVKPGLMSWFGGVEGPSFHESFGDIAAMLTALNQDSVLNQVVAETGGDLHKPNVVARLGEEMSAGINNAMLHGKKPADWVMRDANNTLKYQDPATLPEKPKDIDDLFREPHSLSRVFTGAYWDLLSSLNDGFRQQGSDPKQALIQARDVMTSLTARTLELMPNRLKRLSQVSDAMLQADQRYFGGKFHKDIEQAMAGRNLLSGKGGDSKRLPEISLPEEVKDLEGANHWRAQQGPGLPGGDSPLKAEAMWKNDQGETFLRFGNVEEVELDADTVTDLGASLTLGFDAQGKLFHSQYEPVDAESVQLASQEVAVWRNQGAILGDSGRQRGGAHNHGAVGYSMELPATKGGPKTKIFRIPASN